RKAGKLPLKNGDVGNERHRHARCSDPRFGLRPPASLRRIAGKKRVSRRTQRPSRFAVLDGIARAVRSQVGRKCRAYTARDAELFNGDAEADCADANEVASEPRTENTGALA